LTALQKLHTNIWSENTFKWFSLISQTNYQPVQICRSSYV